MKITTTINFEEHPLAQKHGEFRIVLELDGELPQIFSGAFPLIYDAQDAVDKNESMCAAIKDVHWTVVAATLNHIYQSRQLADEAAQVKT